MSRRTSGTGHYASVYTPARLEEIAAAVQAWFENLPSPKNANAREILGVSQQAIHRWRKGGGPKPIFMYRLWESTKNRVFLLRGEERDAWLKRSVEIPDGFPIYAEGEGADRPRAPEPPETGTPLPLDTLEAQLGNGVTILHAFLLSFEALTSVGHKFITPPMRERVAKIVLRLVKAFGLRPEDFRLGPQEETDPARRETVERILRSFKS